MEPPDHRRTLVIERHILDRNDALAQANRRWLAERRIVALNMMSSPGSGKTTLLQRTIGELQRARPVAVIEGDQETHLDAERIRSTGVPVVQINTGAGCHLDADMLRRGLEALDPADDSVVFVENVGNLVCPALFDLGETARVVVISVTEGDDKPLKYPHMFCGGRPAHRQQDRPAALCRLQRGAMHRQRARRQPGAGRAAHVRHRR